MKKDDSIFVAFVVMVFIAFAVGLLLGGSLATNLYEGRETEFRDEYKKKIEAKDEEIAFWRGTIKSLSDGNQLEGVNLK